MRSGRDRILGAFVALALAGMLCACQAGGKGPGAGWSPVRVSPRHVQARVKEPPPPSATPRTRIGEGKVSVKTANAAEDVDRHWIQQLDFDGDGAAEQAELLWDDEDRVLFAYAETDVPCARGGIAIVGLLICVNGKGNVRGRQPGSGFYVVYLDATECGATVSGLHGCTFNATGEAIECGAATIDDASDAIRITSDQKN